MRITLVPHPFTILCLSASMILFGAPGTATAETSLSDRQSQTGTADSFIGELTLCAGGLKISVSGSLQGSLRDIYEGAQASGEDFTFDSVGPFLSLIPEPDRLEAYRIFASCIVRHSAGAQPDINLIAPVLPFYSETEMEDIQGYVHPDYQEYHSAFIRVRIRFSDETYNTPTFLSSFDSVEVKQPEGVYARIVSCGNDRSLALECILLVEGNDEFRIGTQLSIKFGPALLTQRIERNTFQWRRMSFDVYDKGVPWWVSFSDVSYSLQTPNWIVISDAELLTATDGVELLRLTATNPTDQSAVLSNFWFQAVQPNFSGYACAGPDEPQTTTLNWEKLAFGEDAAVTTDLQGMELPVQATFNFEGICSSYSLEMTVPIDERVEAKTSRQIFLRVKELPPSPGKRSREDGLDDLFALAGEHGPPKRLANWEFRHVALEASAGREVRPMSLSVDGASGGAAPGK